MKVTLRKWMFNNKTLDVLSIRKVFLFGWSYLTELLIQKTMHFKYISLSHPPTFDVIASDVFFNSYLFECIPRHGFKDVHVHSNKEEWCVLSERGITLEVASCKWAIRRCRRDLVTGVNSLLVVMVRLWDSDVADLRCRLASIELQNWCKMRPLQVLGKCRKAHVLSEYQDTTSTTCETMMLPKVCSSEVLLPTPTSWWMWHPHCFWVSSQLSVLLCPRRTEQRLVARVDAYTRCWITHTSHDE